ncbi:MAG: helix-turn-helix transcriptional regulator [Ktedonobacterales bacterium]|nr:helix-turn-helix transcriptional regulator [Ktedonobacterales bacterium]
MPRITLKQARIQAGMTQMKVAIALDMSLSYVQGMEGRGLIPRVDVAQRLAALYGVSVDDLEWGTVDKAKPGNPGKDNAA